jgi:hypothetical protein
VFGHELQINVARIEALGGVEEVLAIIVP